MPGLDESDLIAFLRVIDAPRPDITVRAAGFIETVQGKIKGYEAHIAAVPEDRLLYERPETMRGIAGSAEERRPVGVLAI
jgi:hypothetical protein